MALGGGIRSSDNFRESADEVEGRLWVPGSDDLDSGRLLFPSLSSLSSSPPVTTSLWLSMLVTEAFRSTSLLSGLSSLTVKVASCQPYWERIGPNTSSTSLLCFAFTTIDFLLGSSSLKRTLGSTLTSLQPRLEQSSERSKGRS